MDEQQQVQQQDEDATPTWEQAHQGVRTIWNPETNDYFGDV